MMRKKALVIGGSGSLGRILMNDFSKDFDVSGTYNKNYLDGLIHLDITNKSEIENLFKKINPDIVLITAAKTNVEECEKFPMETYVVNFLGVKNIISQCKGRKVVFYSTDNIFDGSKAEYFEQDFSNPLNEYGRAKAQSEKIVLDISEGLVCRSSRFYGLNLDSPKYLNKVISSLMQGKSVKAPLDTEGNFTFIPDISNATMKLVQDGRSGIYHVAGSGYYSLYDAAFKVASIFGFNPSQVEPVDKDYFNGIVKRPSSPLNINKLENVGIKMKNLEEGLKEIKYQNGK